jgi:ABC-type branched-subunit amino acid transport system substrate-binding protein
MKAIALRVVWLTLVILAAACGDNDGPLRIAYLMPPQMDMGAAGTFPSTRWALANVNEAGGVYGRPLVIDFLTPTDDQLDAVASRVAADDQYIAAIAPNSNALARIADRFVEAQKPLVSFTSAAADLLRAYGGSGVVWRTRQSDIAQTELLVRFAKEEGRARLALLTTLDASGYTFFSWFGFFAREIGFAESDIHIGVLETGQACDAKVKAAAEFRPDMIFVAASTPEQLECIARSLPAQRPRLVVADTGLDPYDLARPGLGPVEGFSASGDEAFTAGFRARYGAGVRVPPHGASEYDAILLLAYGLGASRGQGGKALVDGLKAVADGRGQGPTDWQAKGIAAAMSMLGAGQRPALRGATGPLVFEPGLYMDLASSTLSHFTVSPQGLTFDRRYSTGDAAFLVSGGVLARASLGRGSAIAESSWTPAAERADTWALIASLSSGWSNYRHQADALRQYQLLKAGGVPDDHIVLLMADDLAASPTNKLPGTVRNQPGGVDLYAGAAIDYRLTLSADELMGVLLGRTSQRTPQVLKTTATSNLYVYLVGHGGPAGMPMAATTVEGGLEEEGDILTPKHLREALCTLQSEGRMRRALVVIESCYSGVFGEAASGGIEKGCGTDESPKPLNGTVLISAANSREVSYAGAYDASVGAWVNDAFSNQFATLAAGSPSPNLADLYADVYLRVAGSHASLFNTAAAGRVKTVLTQEFLRR